MTDRWRRVDLALAGTWILAWTALCAFVALSIPSWQAWLGGAGMSLGYLPETVWELGSALRTAPGVLLAIAAIAVGSSPLSRPGWASRCWFGLGLVQAVVLAVMCEGFFARPEPAGPGELGRCGTSLWVVPTMTFFCLGAPLMFLQACAWSCVARSAMRAPRGLLGDEIRVAAVIAALPSIAVTVGVHADGGVRWTAPDWLLVPVPLAVSITACGLLLGGAMCIRQRAVAQV